MRPYLIYGLFSIFRLYPLDTTAVLTILLVWENSVRLSNYYGEYKVSHRVLLDGLAFMKTLPSGRVGFKDWSQCL